VSTLQENQSLNIEYERNKKEREMKEEIERLKNDIKRITEITNQKIKIINDVREYMALNIRVKLNEEFGETMQYKTIYEILEGDKE
jgi:hypothetical protein